MFAPIRALAATASFALTLSALAGLPCGVYVAPAGDDIINNGLVPTQPLRTINTAIILAQQEGLSCVFVQAGDYVEVVRLASGVNVDGGYDTTWVRDDRSLPDHRVRIIGEFDKSLDRFVTVVAENLDDIVTVSNLVINGPRAGGMTPAGDGMSSYAAWIQNSVVVRFRDVTINAGFGADGAAGTPIFNPAPQGSPGSPGESVGSCNDSLRPTGGPGAINSGIANTRGGMGGRGGRADRDCSFPFDFSADPGDPGMSATAGPGTGGGSGCVCNSGGPGSGGLNGATGARGFLAPDTISATSAGVTPTPGGPGASGAHGTGGGGGGGAGGLPSSVGGRGGRSGGASIGVFCMSSSVSLSSTHININLGGSGGDGGAGALGQPGGAGGPGGSTPGSAVGGTGGTGGAGVNGPAGFAGPSGTLSPGYTADPGRFINSDPGLNALAAERGAGCSILPCVDPVADCAADLTGDGAVNSVDLAVLLGSWGPCP